MGRKRISHQIVTEAVPICSDTIGDLDNGTCRRLIDHAISALLSDLSDRGHEDGKPRTLAINIEFIKIDGKTVITPRVDAKIPPRVAHSTQAMERIGDGGEVLTLFQPWNAENAAQPVFNVDENETPEKG